MRKKTLVKNTLILTSASLITRVLGFVYRVYLANTIGALGMGLYGLIVPLYILCWSISCSGFTTTISKEVASYKAKGDYLSMQKVLKYGSIMSVSIATVLSILLYIFASSIAKRFYMDINLILPIKLLSSCIPFMALGSCVRGYFFGIQNSVVPALSQLIEQITRMLVVFLLSATFIPMGQSYAVALCILGISISEIVSCLFVMTFVKTKKVPQNKSSVSDMQIISLIFFMALPLTLNRVSGSLLSTVENMLIPIKLQEFGLTKIEAVESFGMVTGMAIPIIYFPSALLTSISISLVPAISESISIGNKKTIDKLIRQTITFTVIIGCFSASVFTCFSKEIGMVIFNQNLQKYLFVFGIMCPLLYVQMITGGILNGLSKQLFIFKNSLLSSIIVILFIYFLMPSFGIDAFLAGLFASVIITNTLSLNKISQESQTKSKIYDIFILPSLSAIGAFLVTKLIYKSFIFSLFNETISLIIGIGFISIIYFFFIIATGTIKINEISKMFSGVKNYIPKNNLIV